MSQRGQWGLDSYSYHLAFGKHPDFKPRQPIDVEEFLRRAAALGLSGVEIDPLHLESSDAQYVKRIRLLAEKLGLWLEYGMCGVNPAEAADALALSSALGAKVLRAFIGVNRYSRTTSLSDQLGAAVRNLKQSAPHAEKLGIKIAVENHADVTSAELVEVIRRVNSPMVGVCLDVGNSLPVFEDPLEAARQLAPKTFNVHFKDYQLVHTNYGCKIVGVPLGQGIINLKAIAGILRSAAPDANLNIEIPFEADVDESTALEREDKGIQESVRYAREFLS